jgi:hypothetical protein
MKAKQMKVLGPVIYESTTEERSRFCYFWKHIIESSRSSLLMDDYQRRTDSISLQRTFLTLQRISNISKEQQYCKNEIANFL